MIIKQSYIVLLISSITFLGISGLQSVVYLSDSLDFDSSYAELKLEEESETETNEETEVRCEAHHNSLSFNIIKRNFVKSALYSHHAIKLGDQHLEVDTPPPEC